MFRIETEFPVAMRRFSVRILGFCFIWSAMQTHFAQQIRMFSQPSDTVCVCFQSMFI